MRKNERGSVLILVVVLMGVVLIMVPTISTYISSLSKQSRQYFVNRENLRIGEELGLVVAQAYEYGQQLATAGQTCAGLGYYNVADSSAADNFCFQNSGGNQTGNCVTSDFAGNVICLDLTTAPIVIGRTDRDRGKYVFHAKWRNQKTADAASDPMFLKRSNHARAAWLSWLLPEAQATPGADLYRPPNPTGISNSFATITCTGTGDPSICRACGVGQNFICFQMNYCPADTHNGTAGGCSAEVSMGIMVARSISTNVTVVTVPNNGSTALTGNFVVPSYTSLTVQMWGGGGGGGDTGPSAPSGSAGGDTTFNSMTAGGGGGGGGSFTTAGSGGTAGTATGGATNTAGNAGTTSTTSDGGAGGDSFTGSGGSGGPATAPSPYAAGSNGNLPGGGGGGGGGYCCMVVMGGGGGGGGGYVLQVYATGGLTVGTSMPYSVGAGGAGGSQNSSGGTGGGGQITFTYY
jgi:hypothetical protein